METEDQFMFGSSLMVAPILEPMIRTRFAFFPDDPFFDFYDGTFINKKGESYHQIKADIDVLPMFIRGGFIVFTQKKGDALKITDMRSKSVDIVLALNNESYASGRLVINLDSKLLFYGR